MENRDYIGWINHRAMEGRDFFTKDDFVKDFVETNDSCLQKALFRLIDGGLVVSPWQNFYVIVPTEYKLKGVIPPSYYIDELMRFLERDYYVGLLSAASIYGAGHQRAQVFFVVTNGLPMREGIKNGTRIKFTQRKDIPHSGVRQVKTQTGMMNVSSPLMTALDVVYLESKIGGLSRATEVIAELDEAIELTTKDYELIKQYPTPVIQRFGYVLTWLGCETHATWLQKACTSLGITFRYTPLKAGKETGKDCERNKQWKVIINNEIEIDEL